MHQCFQRVGALFGKPFRKFLQETVSQPTVAIPAAQKVYQGNFTLETRQGIGRRTNGPHWQLTETTNIRSVVQLYPRLLTQTQAGPGCLLKEKIPRF